MSTRNLPDEYQNYLSIGEQLDYFSGELHLDSARNLVKARKYAKTAPSKYFDDTFEQEQVLRARAYSDLRRMDKTYDWTSLFGNAKNITEENLETAFRGSLAVEMEHFYVGREESAKELTERFDTIVKTIQQIQSESFELYQTFLKKNELDDRGLAQTRALATDKLHSLRIQKEQNDGLAQQLTSYSRSVLSDRF